VVIEGREGDHDDRYRTGERSGLLSNFTALEPTEQRISLTARIFEYFERPISASIVDYAEPVQFVVVARDAAVARLMPWSVGPKRGNSNGVRQPRNGR